MTDQPTPADSRAREELASCPFCGVELQSDVTNTRTHSYFYHPFGEKPLCPASSLVVNAADAERARAWNRRVGTAPGAEGLLKAVKASKALLDNISEFDTITDGEFLDAAHTAVEAALATVPPEPRAPGNELAVAHRGTSVVNAGVVISPAGRKLCTSPTYEAAQEVAAAWNAANG